LQSTEALCALRSIFNFKSEIIDPNYSIWYSYQNLLVNQFIYLFLEFFAIFSDEEKMTWSENSGSTKNDGFSPIQKNYKWIQKNVKFGLLKDFDMEIRLSDLDRSFLT
jgi:hypothetical protein